MIQSGTLRVRVVYRDVRNVPRNHIRYVTTIFKGKNSDHSTKKELIAAARSTMFIHLPILLVIVSSRINIDTLLLFFVPQHPAFFCCAAYTIDSRRCSFPLYFYPVETNQSHNGSWLSFRTYCACACVLRLHSTHLKKQQHNIQVEWLHLSTS